MGFVVHKVALRQVCSLFLQFFLLSIIPPTIRSHLYLHVALTRRTNRGKFGASKRSGRLAVLETETLHFPQPVTLHDTE